MKQHLWLITLFQLVFVHLALAQTTREITKDSVCYQIDDQTGEAVVLGFKENVSLKKVVFPCKIRDAENEYTVTELRRLWPNDLEEITIPETVKRIATWAFENCKKLKRITLPANAPASWFVKDAFQRAEFEELKFSAPPNNFIQLGKFLYSRSRKTIYDIRNLQDTIYFVPESVDSVFFNLKWNFTSPYHIVLHRDIKYIQGKDEKYKHKRLYVPVPIDDAAPTLKYLYENKILAGSYSVSLDNQYIIGSKTEEHEFFKKAQYPDEGNFLLDVDLGQGVELVTLDYIYRSSQPDPKNRHVEIRESKQENLTPPYIPIKVSAIPKPGKRIVGYVYFNDTIVGETCTISSSFTRQRLKVLSADTGTLISGVDYKLSSDRRVLLKWSAQSPLVDLRNTPEFAEVQNIAPYSLEVSRRCRELLLPNTTETIDAECLNSPTSLDLLVFPASLKTIHPLAFKELLSVSNLYFQGEPTIAPKELEKAFSTESTRIQQLLVNAESLAFWKGKLTNSPLLPFVKGVEQELHITNSEPDKIIVTVRSLADGREFQLKKDNTTVSLPRTSPVQISLRPLLSYDLRRMVLNGKVLESASVQTSLLDTLRVSSQGETIRFHLAALPSVGGKIHLTTLDGNSLEANVELLRGTKFHLKIEPTPPFLFKHWTFNGQISQTLDTVMELRQHLLLTASFYRRKPLLDLDGVDRRCRFTLLDSETKSCFFEELYEGDTVFVQAPIIPDGQEINTFEINGVSITKFPHKLVVPSSLTIKATLMPKLCKVTLSEVAAKYLEILDENGTKLTLETGLPYNTKCFINFRGKISERLAKLSINTAEYPLPTFPLVLMLRENVNIDAEVMTLFNVLQIELPFSCILTINDETITRSTVYRAEHGTPLTIKVNSGEAYTVTGLQLDNKPPVLERELSFVLSRNQRLTVLAAPNPVELTYEVTGNGQVSIRASDDTALDNHATVRCDDELMLELLPAPEHECIKLLINGNEIPPRNTKLRVTGALNIQANFAPYTYENVNGVYINRRKQEVVGCVSDMVKLKLAFDQDFRIADNAFLANKNLQEVDLQFGVSSIGTKAFSGSAIKKVYLGQCVSAIERNAFTECNNLLLMDLEHTDPTSLKLVASALTARKKEGFLLRVPNTAVDAFSNHSSFAKFKIVPARVAYQLEGNFGDAEKNVTVEMCDYWESDGEDHSLPAGMHDLAGGTRITFKNNTALQEKIDALYVNNKRVKLPYTHILLKPVIFRIQFAESKTRTAIEQLSAAQQFRITPNPVRTFLTVQTSTMIPATYQILNTQGDILQAGILTTSQQIVAVQNLPQGFYFLRLCYENREIVKTFVKE